MGAFLMKIKSTKYLKIKPLNAQPNKTQAFKNRILNKIKIGLTVTWHLGVASIQLNRVY